MLPIVVRTGRPGSRARLLGAACAALALTMSACDAAPPEALPSDAAGFPVQADDVRPVGPLTELPACAPPEPPASTADLPPVYLPEGAIVTEVQHVEPVVSILAWVPLTPSQVRRAYESQPDLEILTREDESLDSEVLVTDGELRSYIEAVADCDQGSRILVVVSRETGGERTS